ncbi:hypothetical protein [Mangrovicoccus algicola]|uniref:Uncharacterized protein n=1 Tax=Mangrovicoccus algicola TaxID=2771008 RepID=A0A8J7CJX8_9RHOB|nr:hypothetical protein [Mangrovicoccus algicola]MBE3638026.1 hypothetical protein [Mangrovicoccus algicola]
MYIAPVSAVSPSGDNAATYFMTFDQAVDVWILHWRGQKQQEIAVQLGTNQLRVDAVLNERQHVGSRQKAQQVAYSFS